VGVEITGPYSAVMTIGAPHLSLADRGLTFASNADRGVCIRFAEPVRGIEALGIIRHPALTVTVDASSPWRTPSAPECACDVPRVAPAADPPPGRHR
jgi:hypothetical protein